MSSPHFQQRSLSHEGPETTVVWGPNTRSEADLAPCLPCSPVSSLNSGLLLTEAACSSRSSPRTNDLAKSAGRKGGHSTSEQFAYGKKAWGVAMAMGRWYGTRLPDAWSRAPEAKAGDKGDGASESASASGHSRRKKRQRE
jgi:hypothetical protein